MSGNVLQFIDSDFPFNLNEKEADGVTTKYLIDGVAAKYTSTRAILQDMNLKFTVMTMRHIHLRW